MPERSVFSRVKDRKKRTLHTIMYVSRRQSLLKVLENEMKFIFVRRRVRCNHVIVDQALREKNQITFALPVHFSEIEKI